MCRVKLAANGELQAELRSSRSRRSGKRLQSVVESREENAKCRCRKGWEEAVVRPGGSMSAKQEKKLTAGILSELGYDSSSIPPRLPTIALHRRASLVCTVWQSIAGCQTPHVRPRKERQIEVEAERPRILERQILTMHLRRAKDGQMEYWN